MGENNAGFWALILGAFLLIIVGFIALDAAGPHSQNVTFDGRSAVIHEGGRLILLQYEGKVINQWTISKDGDRVKMACDSFCPDKSPKLCGVGCTIHPDFGWLTDNISITQINDTELLVKWPWDIDHK